MEDANWVATKTFKLNAGISCREMPIPESSDMEGLSEALPRE
jgi:hypothetical protein